MVIRFRRRFQILLSSAMDVLIVCGILFGMGARSHFPNVEPPVGSRYHRARSGLLRQTVVSPGHCQCTPSHPGQAINSQDSANWCTGWQARVSRHGLRSVCSARCNIPLPPSGSTAAHRCAVIALHLAISLQFAQQHARRAHQPVLRRAG